MKKNMTEQEKLIHQKRALFAAMFSGFAIVFLYWAHIPFAVAIDAHDERCLPMRAAILWKVKPTTIGHGDYLFWKPYGALSEVKDEFILKQVAGVPGDHLTITKNKVLINGQLIATGLKLYPLYNKNPKDFERDEVIPTNEYFLVGQNELSNDSRYWGYLDQSKIVGKAYRLF